MRDYDAFLVVSFGGPEKREDVLPFLENVVRGRNVPRQRLLEVAEHYYELGGASPINQQCRDLIAALQQEFYRLGIELPIFWGNRNWHPFLADTVRQMGEAGIRRVLAMATSAWSSYSSCRQYLIDIARAREQCGSNAPTIDKLRPFYNHPGFIEAWADRVAVTLQELPDSTRASAELIFTAHSIPRAMAAACAYERQLHEASRLVAERAGHKRWSLAYQSRSGPPSQPWTGPDINDHLVELAHRDVQQVVLAPIGFLSDHMEVRYDLDHEARATCRRLGLSMLRCPTVGTHPRLIRMVGELVLERLHPESPRRAVGEFPPLPDECPPDCCPLSAPSTEATRR